MQWAAIGVAALAVVVGIVAITNNVFGGLSVQVEENGDPVSPTVDVRQLRDAQRLANASYEIVLGQVLVSGIGQLPDGSFSPPGPDGNKVYAVRFQVRNLSERTLHHAFWAPSVAAYNDRGEEVFAQITLRDSYGSQTGGVPPLSVLTGTMSVRADQSAASFVVSLGYQEPGQTAQSVNFVYPYGR